MTGAADIIQALIARAPARPLVERSTGMPYGWALWMKAAPPLPGTARAGEMAAALLQRPRTAPVREPELGPWHAFLGLFRQGWLPAPRDERPMRWASGTSSLLLHLLFIVALAWIAWLQARLPPPPAEAGGGGERVEVGFIGRGDPGTPQAGEGGQGDAAPAPPAATSRESAQAARAAAADAAPPASPEVQAAEITAPPIARVEIAADAPSVPVPPEMPLAVREVPEPEIAPPAAEQPVQVTEVERPTREYVLPPTTTRQVPARPMPEVQVRQREVAVVEIPSLQPPPRAVDLQAPRPAEPQLRRREVDEPLPELAVRPVDLPVPRRDAELRAPEAAVRQRELSLPAAPDPSADASAAAPSSASGPASASVAAASAAPTPGRAPGSAARDTSSGNAPAGSRPAASSGWESALRGDDWGQSSTGERRPGGAPGLFDGQGRVRLPGEGQGEGPGQGPGQGPGEGTAERGAPGGENDAWTRERIEQAGTWLKRPPYDYEPTRFDRYWVPNESLLAEWVRKGIQSVAIPIPGTRGKKINCVISLLQLGGGCGITDPNLNEQPAVARPPPDVPFKPELQEADGATPPA
ncbi:hypothetical protein B1992_01205 [Pseudoxanthomonas broegbernensis]|uniref:Transmembrane repetitive protein n=1 Tax=Pseudoxanthomonas broegbernensis TaxID=83619 RepID=A0A7V8GQ29_9GAMM|nr:hypothetical protein [Pseudoxanthomonas broegbernensis]KAF1688072.1 hypothetical protein B1992_01205 [Pseudoxanthomonas broegbernensis]MBB6065108.1 hypothetical protein [Pseudoxanthomonas broegbernensis]